MKDSAIQWTDHTFNPWEGCTKVAPECKNCYAETLVDKRFGRAKWGKGQPRRRTSAAYWKQPLTWNRAAAEEMANNMELGPSISGPAHRPRVFCLSLGDWLDEEVPIEWLADLLALIRATPNLDWQLLTKRPQNWRVRMEHVVGLSCVTGCSHDDPHGWAGWLANRWQDGIAPENIWIGVSAGANQKAALDIPAKIHFLSCEPMLHPFDHRWAAGFDWIIFGGESGKNARPCDIGWIREGLKFCRHYEIAPFVKQLGAKPYYINHDARSEFDHGGGMMELRDSHGGDMSEWPEDLRVREFPKAAV